MSTQVIITADTEFLSQRLLANAEVLSKYQFLRQTLAKINDLRATCGTCTGKKTAAESEIQTLWNDIRSYLLGLPEADRDFIRAKAQIKPNQRVRIAYLVGSGTTSKIERKFF